MIRRILDFIGEFIEVRVQFANARLQVLEVSGEASAYVHHGNCGYQFTAIVLGTGLDIGMRREGGMPWQFSFIAAILTVPFRLRVTLGAWPEPDPDFIEELLDSIRADEARIRNEAGRPHNRIVIATGEEPEDFGDDEAVFDWLVEAER